jgi:hypothetical protein
MGALIPELVPTPPKMRITIVKGPPPSSSGIVGAVKRTFAAVASALAAADVRDYHEKENARAALRSKMGIAPTLPWSYAATIRAMFRAGVDPRKRSVGSLNHKELRGFRRAMLDEVADRHERMERWDAAAETHLVSSFPSGNTPGTHEIGLVGNLKPAQILRELMIIATITLQMNSGTGTIVAADHNILGAALYNKIRASLYGKSDMYNLMPAEARNMDAVFSNRDSLTTSLKVGQGLTTTPATFQLTFQIPWCFRSLEVPEIFTGSTDQFNLSGNKVDIDSNMTGLTTLSIAGGTGTMAVSQVTLYYNSSPAYILHAGPPIEWRSRQIAQSQDPATGQACDLFLGFEETVAASAARVSQLTVYRDGRAGPENMDPLTLSQRYGATIEQIDALCPIDITGTANGSQQGASLVPITWIDGRVKDGAFQWPTWGQSRSIYQLLQSGGSASVNLLYAQVDPIYDIQGSILTLAAQNGLAISKIDDLMVNGGNDGTAMSNFKGRLMALKSSIPS